MAYATESTPLNPLTRRNLGTWFAPNVYPYPLTYSWRAAHCSAYLLGGFSFVLGSLCYFPALANYPLGGWAFTIGSVGFLFADLFEWWTNNRVGCFDSPHLREDLEALSAKAELVKDRESFVKVDTEAEAETETEEVWQAANGVNFFYSAFGSFLYLWGSALYIPRLDGIVLGTQLFIVGSFVILTSQSWKLYRYPDYSDLPATHVDAAAGLGGLFYLIGSVLFLGCVTDTDTARAAAVFTLGGTSFAYSGLAMAYRYFLDPVPKY